MLVERKLAVPQFNPAKKYSYRNRIDAFFVNSHERWDD